MGGRVACLDCLYLKFQCGVLVHNNHGMGVELKA